jgi:hypothetical protein
MLDTVDMARLIMHRNHLSRLQIKPDPVLLKPDSSGVFGALDGDLDKFNGRGSLQGPEQA